MSSFKIKEPSVEEIVADLNDRKPLPMGREEFEEWSDRIIAGAMIPYEEDKKDIFIEGQKFALANMILHLGPTESHKPDAHFIHTLRKVCTNQVAHTVILELKAAQNARAAAEKAAESGNEATIQ